MSELITAIFSTFTTVIQGLASGLKTAFSQLLYVDPAAADPMGFSCRVHFPPLRHRAGESPGGSADSFLDRPGIDLHSFPGLSPVSRDPRSDAREEVEAVG